MNSTENENASAERLSRNPYLYIFIRDDMKTMVPGRAAAQASHATSIFHHWMAEAFDDYMERTGDAESSTIADQLVHLANEWATETPQGFGTTIVKKCSPDDLEFLHGMAESEGIFAEYTIDPDYVIKDGAAYFSSEVVTALVLFGAELLPADSQLLDNIKFHPLF